MDEHAQGGYTDPPRQPKNTLLEHLTELRQKRYNAIKADIPEAGWSRLTKARRQIVENYITLALDHYGRRGLARVVWPWTYRSTTAARPPRGKLTNPTALR